MLILLIHKTAFEYFSLSVANTALSFQTLFLFDWTNHILSIRQFSTEKCFSVTFRKLPYHWSFNKTHSCLIHNTDCLPASIGADTAPTKVTKMMSFTKPGGLPQPLILLSTAYTYELWFYDWFFQLFDQCREIFTANVFFIRLVIHTKWLHTNGLLRMPQTWLRPCSWTWWSSGSRIQWELERLKRPTQGKARIFLEKKKYRWSARCA